jgi:hypothetical protein
VLLKPKLLAAASLIGSLVVTVPSSAGLGDILGFPFRWLGGQLVQGGADRLKGTIQDVDVRLQAHETRLSDMIADTKGKLDDTVDKVDRGLEARILQLETATNDSVRLALTQVDDTLRRRLIQADSIGQGLIRSLNTTVVDALKRADVLLRERTADLERAGNGMIEHADTALQNRIAQLDEAAGRRLGNVDVLATKQRTQLEKALLRLAVLIGIVGIVAYVLRTLWKRYLDLQRRDLSGVRGPTRAALYVREFLPTLSLGVLGTGAAVGVMLALYVWLPQGPSREAEALVRSHRQLLEAALLRVDYPSARLHASNLEYLAPDEAALTNAMADMTGLMRDIVERPTLLAAPAMVVEFAKRLAGIERAFDGRPDADLLSLRGYFAWATGSTRSAEHQAASYSARALRLAPRGFAMAPLARAQLRIFLNAPYFPESGEQGRDALTVEELEAALADSEPDSRLSPFAPMAELAQLMSELELGSSRQFVDLVNAHARGDYAARNAAAEDIVQRWIHFDQALAANPAFGGSVVLNVFRLNDAILTHARWFLAHPDSAELPPPIESLPRTPEGLDMRLLLAPARVIWARRYEALFQGATRALAEFEEAERFRAWERWTLEFERAAIAAKNAPASDERARWGLVVAAAALSLYVDGPSRPVAYASRVAAGLSSAPPAAAPPARRAGGTSLLPLQARPETPDAPVTLAGALSVRGPRLL